MEKWRLIDTGLRPAAENIALNRALLEARKKGESPNTLRFLQFTPSALLGFHQSAEQELNLDYCREQGISVQRRISGGGAIYFDETQIGWELYLGRRALGMANMEEITRRICEAAATGIRALGVDAQFRPRNDIEVGGRKISGTGGVFDGDGLMFQGSLLVQFDVEKMLRVLRIPAEKLSDKAISSARERVANLADLLGYAPPLASVKSALSAGFSQAFSANMEAGALSGQEQGYFESALKEIASPEWVDLVQRPASDLPLLEAVEKFPGGLLRVALTYDKARRRIGQAWFTGDFFVMPTRTINDLEAALKQAAEDKLESIVHAFFHERNVDMSQLQPRDFTAIVRRAISHARPS